MENPKLHGCAPTNGSNHLTNNLSVTALTRLLPVFLMMIFLGIGTDVLGQQRNIFTGTATFNQDQLNKFDGKPNKTDEVSELTSGVSSGVYIKLSSSSANVQATLDNPRGTKVRYTGAFAIEAMGGGQQSQASLSSLTEKTVNLPVLFLAPKLQTIQEPTALTHSATQHRVSHSQIITLKEISMCQTSL